VCMLESASHFYVVRGRFEWGEHHPSSYGTPPFSITVAQVAVRFFSFQDLNSSSGSCVIDGSTLSLVHFGTDLSFSHSPNLSGTYSTCAGRADLFATIHFQTFTKTTHF